MYTKIKHNGRELIASLYGEIDHHTAIKMREEIDTEVQRTHPAILKLDFENIKFMDSSGIGLIMGRYKLMKLYGGKLLIIKVPIHLQRLIILSGVSNLGVLEM